MRQTKHYTLHFLITVGIALLIVACGTPAPEVPPTPTLAPGSPEALGKAIFQGSGSCATCHSLKTNVRIVGPSLSGINDVAGTRVEGLTAEEYLLQSIMRPNDYIVEGYENVAMDPTIALRLSLEEINQVVAYLQTLE